MSAIFSIIFNRTFIIKCLILYCDDNTISTVIQLNKRERKKYKVHQETSKCTVRLD